MRFREAAKQVGDELLVVLVAGMVTEEALPNYATPAPESISPPPPLVPHHLGAIEVS
jgi:hypothetical protein